MGLNFPRKSGRVLAAARSISAGCTVGRRSRLRLSFAKACLSYR
jgi:hypothetical protein